MLAGPQRADRALVGGQRGQVVAAEALDRDHGPAEQRGGGRADRVPNAGVVVEPLPPADEPQPGAAVVAADRLRVEPAVDGSWYSAAQAGHIGNPRIVVVSRS